MKKMKKIRRWYTDHEYIAPYIYENRLHCSYAWVCIASVSRQAKHLVCLKSRSVYLSTLADPIMLDNDINMHELLDLDDQMQSVDTCRIVVMNKHPL